MPVPNQVKSGRCASGMASGVNSNKTAILDWSSPRMLLTSRVLVENYAVIGSRQRRRQEERHVQRQQKRRKTSSVEVRVERLNAGTVTG